MAILTSRAAYVKVAERSGQKLADFAQEYFDFGWSIIPLIGKKPAVAWKKYQQSRPDEDTLRRMFAGKKVTGLGVVLGGVSGGLACRDFDRLDAYARWKDGHAKLAKMLPTAQTARGYHVYFRAPSEDFEEFDDGEYRADSGHYCALPPSVHPDGACYRWITPVNAKNLPILDPMEMGFRRPRPSAETQATHSTHCMCQIDGIEAAIVATLPTRPGQRNRRIFRFAHKLKAIMPEAGWSELDGFVREWHRRALPVIRTKEWEETWVDFCVSWLNILHPASGRWESIIHSFETSTVPTGDYQGTLGDLVRLCIALQSHHGPSKSWPLSCRKAGEAIGTSHDTAAKLLKFLTLEGVLEITKLGGTAKSKQAAEYRISNRSPFEPLR